MSNNDEYHHFTAQTIILASLDSQSILDEVQYTEHIKSGSGGFGLPGLFIFQGGE